MRKGLIIRVTKEESVALVKWGDTDRTLNGLLAAVLEETGEVAHAINHNEGVAHTEQEIVEAIGVLSRIYNWVEDQGIT